MTLEREHALPPGVACLWAKTGSTDKWHSLGAHLMDSVHIADRLWNEWLSQSTRRWLAAPVGDDDAGRALLTWLAGCHDLGKASPAFQMQATAHADRVRAAGLPVPPALPERSKAPHAKVSAVAILRLLADGFGWDRASALGPAAILGGHHGWFPERGFWRDAESYPSLFGWSKDSRAPWMAARAALFDLVVDITGVRHVLEAEGIDLGRARELALSGYVILADWLASNTELFPYASMPFRSSYLEESADRARHALTSIGWHRFDAKTVHVDFARRFGFPPNPLQEQMIVTARSTDAPGLFIVEAPMGVGKTEAAFVAIEVLARAHGLGGTFIGLPSQATSNQMFARARRWLEHLDAGTYVMELAHGRAAQVPAFRQLKGSLGSIDVDENGGAQVTAQEWFDGAKRRLLAPFVVGTVDQALLSAAKIKHVALRQTGLMGKVVVVDEVHAYDAHMSVFLRRALRWLGEAGVSVILLSATLPPRSRARLIEAYTGSPVELHDVGYPGVVHIAASGEVTSSHVTLDRPPIRAQLRVMTEPSGQHGDEVAQVVVALARRGANVLVVRNTVRRAQEIYGSVARHLGERFVTLLHARFLAEHRLAKERWLEARFGPDGDRPRGHVVVGTQVLEQSLDVDFDVLVTDLAPIDLVLQRLGRVHRHPGIRRPEGLEAPLVIVVGLSRSKTGPPEFPSGSRAVYAEHLLLRSAALLYTRQSIVLPDEVPLLVERAYGTDQVVPESWAAQAAVAEGKWRNTEKAQERVAAQFALPPPQDAANLLELCRIGIGDRDDDDPGVQAAVRGGAPSIEVVAAWTSHEADTITCVSGPVPLKRRPTPEEVDRALGSTLRLPSSLTSAALRSLAVPPGWEGDPWLRHFLLLGIDRAGGALIGTIRLRYTEALGLEVSHNDKR